MRPARRGDVPAVLDLVVAAELFSRSETPLLRDMMMDYFEAEHANGHRFVVDEQEDAILGVAYYQPREAADRVWDLTMIAVRPAEQRSGRGVALVNWGENELRGRDQRLLMIETSATAQYDRARSFYLKAGFDEEARVRDYWEDGDDLVIFCKSLATDFGVGLQG